MAIKLFLPLNGFFKVDGVTYRLCLEERGQSGKGCIAAYANHIKRWVRLSQTDDLARLRAVVNTGFRLNRRDPHAMAFARSLIELTFAEEVGMPNSR